MRKQQQKSELNNLIKATKINASIETLKHVFQDYQNMEKVKEQRYLIRHKFFVANRMLEKIDLLLEDLIEQSSEWEKIEEG